MGYTVDEDYKLIHRIRKGDEEAAEKFISKYYKDIYCYCYRRIEDKVASEDLTQEVFIKFYTYLDRYTHRGKTKNYLYVIAGNICKNYYKKEALYNVECREEL